MSSSFEPWQPPEWLKNATIGVLFLGMVGMNGYRIYQEWPVHRLSCAFHPTGPVVPGYQSANKSIVFDDKMNASLKLRRDGRVVGTTTSGAGGSIDIFYGSWDVERNHIGGEVWDVSYSLDQADGGGIGDDFSFTIPTDLKSKSTFGFWTPDDVKASLYFDARCREVD